MVVAGLLWTGSAWAQTGGKLEEVVVTAQKREQVLKDVPSSVATLSGEKLDVIKTGGADIRVLSSRVPSLHIESSYGRTLPRFYIRGLGNTDFDLNASQPVSLVYDGVVLENPIIKGYPIFDLDRIEVLRGPQGTLFGRNTPAGIVKFESARPGDEFNGYGRLSYGRFDSVQFEGAAGGPMIDGVLGGRASVLYQRRADWVDNGFTGENDALGGYNELATRFQLEYTPTDRFRLLANLHTRTLNGTARLFRANLVAPGTNSIRSGFDRDEIFVDGQNNQELDQIGGVLTMELDLGSVLLTSITGYETAEFDSVGDVDGGFGAVFAPPSGPFIPVPFTAETADAMPDLDQFTQELRLSSQGDGPLNWQAGVFLFDEELTIESTNFDSLAGNAVNGFVTQSQEADTWAVFGSVEYEVSDALTLTAGLRYSEDEKELTAERTLSPLSFLGVGPLAPITVNPSDEVVAWDVSATYAFNDDTNIYGRIAKGFRAPSIQGRVLFGDVVTVADTEEIISYEAGIKTDLLEGRGRLNFSTYYYTLDDQQLTAVGGAQNFNQIVNADETTGFGFEAELEMLFTDNFLGTLGLSYNDTEIDDPNLGIVPGAAEGLTVLDPEIPGNPGVVSIDGNSLPNAPEWVANLTLRYGWPMPQNSELYVFTDWAYRDEVNFFLYESVEFMEDAMVEGGLRIGYSHDGGRYDISAFGRNITNEEVRTGGIDFNNLTGFVNEEPVWGVEFTSRF